MKKTKKNQPSRDPSNGGRVIDDGPLAPLVKAIGTLPELADLAGMSVTTLRRINRGDREPRAGERVLFSTLAKRFHVATPFRVSRQGRARQARRPLGPPIRPGARPVTRARAEALARAVLAVPPRRIVEVAR